MQPQRKREMLKMYPVETRRCVVAVMELVLLDFQGLWGVRTAALELVSEAVLFGWEVGRCFLVMFIKVLEPFSVAASGGAGFAVMFDGVFSAGLRGVGDERGPREGVGCCETAQRAGDCRVLRP